MPEGSSSTRALPGSGHMEHQDRTAPTMLDVLVREPRLLDFLPEVSDVRSLAATCWDALLALLHHRPSSCGPFRLAAKSPLLPRLAERQARLAQGAATVQFGGTLCIKSRDVGKVLAGMRAVGLSKLPRRERVANHIGAVRKVLEWSMREGRDPIRPTHLRLYAPLAPVQTSGDARVDEEVRRLCGVLCELAAPGREPCTARFSAPGKKCRVTEVDVAVLPDGVRTVRIWRPEDCEEMAALLPQHQHLEQLSVSDAAFYLLQPGSPGAPGQPPPAQPHGMSMCAALAGGLRAVPILRDLRMVMAGLYEPHVKVLAPALASLLNLELLDLSENLLGDDGVSELAAALRDKTGLRTLRLQSVAVWDAGANAIVGAFRAMSSCALTELYLDDSTRNLPPQMMNVIGTGPSQAIAELLKARPSFEALHLPRMSMVPDAEYMCHAVAACPQMRSVHMPAYFIEDRGARVLARSFNRGNPLEYLMLAGVDITDEGARDIAAGAALLPRLEVLDLQMNSLGDRAARALAQHIPDCRTLKRLILFRNDIGDSGAADLGRALAQSRSIVELDVQDNRIGSGGATELALGVMQSTSLRTLNVSKQNIGNDGAAAIIYALRESKSMVCARLVRVGIGHDRGHAMLYDWLADAWLQSKSLAQVYTHGNMISSRAVLRVGYALWIAGAQGKVSKTWTHGPNVGDHRLAVTRAKQDFFSQKIVGKIHCMILLARAVRRSGGKRGGARKLATSTPAGAAAFHPLAPRGTPAPSEQVKQPASDFVSSQGGVGLGGRSFRPIDCNRPFAIIITACAALMTAWGSEGAWSTGRKNDRRRVLARTE
ncbi:unnamed protein product [Pedinophyceae sp. YPF-701]|nr:unnamed protein product [Pedinophyceae sp. YPF-701]